MSKVIDFKTEREERVENKRRDFERVLFENFLGAYSVIDDAGSIYPIQLVDISRSGCLFQVPWDVKNGKQFPSGSEIRMRMYFTQTSYIPVVCKIKYGSEFVDESGQSFMRYGSEFDTEIQSFECLNAFIDFLFKFAETSVEDKGDSRKVYFL